VRSRTEIIFAFERLAQELYRGTTNYDSSPDALTTRKGPVGKPCLLCTACVDARNQCNSISVRRGPLQCSIVFATERRLRS
jgi:hypothetical protein